MLVSFDRAVVALTEAIIRDRPRWRISPACVPVMPSPASCWNQHERMPDYLRFPFQCLTLLFDAWSLPFTGRPFHRASPEQRARRVRAWKESTLGVRRDRIKFYEALAIFAWYSEHGSAS
jgi:hypothetical protein